MSDRRFVVESMPAGLDRSSFRSGNDALDRYFREGSGQDSRRRLAVVYVMRDLADDAVVGFYTLSALSIEPAGLPEATRKRLPRYPIPATLLGRFAIDERVQGQGVGRSLLADALLRALDQSAAVASMAVVVDAKDEAARAFYERNGFVRFQEDEFRLFIELDLVARLRGRT